MSTRKHRFYDVHSGSELGFIDYGGAVVEDSDRLASEALVFLLVPFCGSMKFPIGNFLCEKTPSQVQAELSKVACHFREPIQHENLDKIQQPWEKFSNYLLSLHTTSGEPLHQRRRKLFITGFVCTAKAVICLVKDSLLQQAHPLEHLCLLNPAPARGQINSLR